MAQCLKATAEAIERAGKTIREGRLVGFPTETVYGLGADATNDRAVASIFEAKGRPRFNPLIVHVASFEEAEKHCVFNAEAEKLAKAFWPGGVTLVLPRRAETPLSLLVSAGLDTVAIRVPAHETARALIEAAKRPLAAPSANPSGKVSPTTAAHVMEGLGEAPELALVLDGGACPLGLESTVIGFPQGAPTLLRPGAVAREEIEKVLGKKLMDADAASGEEGRASPGQLESHYAPGSPIRHGLFFVLLPRICVTRSISRERRNSSACTLRKKRVSIFVSATQSLSINQIKSDFAARQPRLRAAPGP